VIIITKYKNTGKKINKIIIINMIKNKNKKILMYIITLFSAVTLLVLTYIGIDYTVSTMNFKIITPALQMPKYLVYIFIPLGFLLGTIEYITTFLLNFRDKENLYLTSEIKIPMDSEIKVDLDTLMEEESPIKEGE